MCESLIVQVSEADGVAAYDLKEILSEGRKRAAELVPARFTNAVVTAPEVVAWVRALVAGAVAKMVGGYPVVGSGPSLVLSGKAGRGKSWQAWGALRALSVSGVACRWRLVTAAEMYASLRPRHGVDSEDVFRQLSWAEVLVIDDLGATKDSAWTDEVFDRLVNDRYQWERPTLITTNVPPAEFGFRFGDRVTSRLVEMASVVSFTGPDLRRAGSR